MVAINKKAGYACLQCLGAKPIEPTSSIPQYFVEIVEIKERKIEKNKRIIADASVSGDYPES